MLTSNQCFLAPSVADIEQFKDNLRHTIYGNVQVQTLFIYLFVFFPFLGPLPRHMEVPRLGVESEL